jgi:metallophosphoesterase (TIGR00282 family)
MIIKILFFGDIVGKIGRQGIVKVLPEYKKKYAPDLIMANAENLAHGIGITAKTLEEVRSAGIDFFTSGNHIWKKNQADEILNEADPVIIRPANYPGEVSGQGEKIVKVGAKKLLVVNLLGRVFMEEPTGYPLNQIECPFKKFDEILTRYQSEKIDGILVDFHAEATSEKVAMGHYLDGRATALVGTHTHIPTADAQIMAKGMGYVTDVGMVGAKDSVIGVDKEVIIKRFLTDEATPHQIPETGVCQVNAVYLEIDPKSKKTTKIIRADQEVEV